MGNINKAERLRRQELNAQGLKHCRGCDEIKGLGEFHRDSRSKDGRHSKCSCCHNSKRRADYEADPEKRLVSIRAYNATEGGKAARKRYQSSEKGKNTLNKWLESEVGRASMREGLARYRSSEKGRAVQKKKEAKRRALKLNAPSDDWTHKEVFDNSDWQCFFCGIEVTTRDNPKQYQPNEAQAEHFISLNRGGTDMRANMVCSCGKCNFSKNAKSGFEVLDGQIGKIQAFLGQNSFEYFTEHNHHLYSEAGEADTIEADFGKGVAA